MTPYQLIVFDWDGTLMDSTGHIVHCMKLAIDKLAMPVLTDVEISHIIGLGLDEAVQTLYPSLSSKQQQQLVQTYRQTWIQTPEETELFDNARALLSMLEEQEILLGVATGKSRRGLDRALAKTGLANHFIATRCADECHSKPHPQMLLELINYAGVAAQETLMIGDTEFDLQMAHNAGADSLALTQGAHPLERLSACSPKAILDDLHQVEKWLAGSDANF
ncbi:MAG TPA: HAD family hydrolase [Methylophaga aminisulfidivorans]|uniref:HAD family hydrolase n=1 Tax=Methylophaga aminisulfidivorans TaxID=230105 RepID=A0A7C1VPX8_9GAMM|nr:HAD family hydrolase [Methylophaga aminisulfidivorans]